MVIAGIVIVVATFIAIIKKFETRLVLLLSGLLMCFIGGNLGAGTTAFVKELTNPGLVPTICTVLGLVMLWNTQNVRSIWCILSLLALKR